MWRERFMEFRLISGLVSVCWFTRGDVRTGTSQLILGLGSSKI